jgi:hypothetical protein
MPEATQGGAPAWMPGSVGSAYRKGAATDTDLLSGTAWSRLLESLERAGAVLGSDRVPRGGVDQAAGYRHLLVLLALGIDEALRGGAGSDPYSPRISPANVDAYLKWGMDCPDAAYSGCALRSDGVYRIRGERGTARYLGFQVMGGMAAMANLVLDPGQCRPDGTFELVLSPEPGPDIDPSSGAGTEPGVIWVPLGPGASSLVVRQFFYDWAGEVPATMDIECVARPAAATTSAPGTLSPAGIARQLVALGDFMETSISFWLDVEDGGRAQGVNTFRPPVNKTEMGAAAENVSVWGSWELAEDEALIVEVAPPSALYWSVSLGNHWWETIDYANHQSSLNGHQAAIDVDGVFRAVISEHDPGVANWLDTAGHRQGPAIFRWVSATGAPVPSTHLVPVGEVLSHLPPTTARVDPAGRRSTIATRRAGVARRFSR